jgi:mycoredoxin
MVLTPRKVPGCAAYPGRMPQNLTDAPVDRVTVYGAEWCKDCRRSKALLDRVGADYAYIDLEAEPEQADRAKAISGRMNIPVVVFPDGTHFVEPTDAELQEKLDALSA